MDSGTHRSCSGVAFDAYLEVTCRVVIAKEFGDVLFGFNVAREEGISSHVRDKMEFQPCGHWLPI